MELKKRECSNKIQGLQEFMQEIIKNTALKNRKENINYLLGKIQ